MNAEEQSENERSVVNTRDALREVSITQTVKGDKQVDRTYNFDQVFGAHATQEDIYDDAVRPVVEEVLEGFNCTIFAYGQTGTGKTHTMEGYHDWDDASSDSFADSMPSNAGVIPRAMSHIFSHLKAKGVEHSVKCTFLELYNEEITDLLAVSDLVEGTVEAANAKAPKHPLMEDGKGGVAVKGLEEVAVANPEEIFDHIRRGSAKRRTAETLMNKQSSRSHSVFSVTVHTKESTPDGEDVIRCGKLNLVDLAGSENISRSGAVDKRAREAGEINKSLLTLGRVIAALVAGGGHVPYRDSKLTRLLRDALGGKSKTCIIATVSPAAHSAEETLQTLEYAHRAKSIKNKPEINQRVTKNALLKDLQKEIERLTADLTATREKNGVYLSQQSYDEQEKERVDLRARADELRSALDLAKSELASLAALFEDQKKAHKALQREHATHAEKVCIAERTARVAHAELSKAQRGQREQAHLADEFEAAQERLRVKTDSLGDALASAKDEMRSLFGKIERYSDVDAANASVIESVRLDVTAHLERLEASLAEVKTAEESARAATRRAVDDAKKARSAEADELRDQLRRTRADAEAATRKAAQLARAAAASAKTAADAALAAVESADAAAAECDLIDESVTARTDAALSTMDAGVARTAKSLDAIADADAARSVRAVELADAQRAAAADARAAVDGLAAEDGRLTRCQSTGGTPTVKTASTMLATPVRREEVREMTREREATLAAFRARTAAGAEDGSVIESAPADEEANDEKVEEEPEPEPAEDEPEEPEPEPADEEEEEVKPNKRGGRSASTRGARGGKTSGIPRAPLRDKNAQAETA